MQRRNAREPLLAFSPRRRQRKLSPAKIAEQINDVLDPPWQDRRHALADLRQRNSEAAAEAEARLAVIEEEERVEGEEFERQRLVRKAEAERQRLERKAEKQRQLFEREAENERRRLERNAQRRAAYAKKTRARFQYGIGAGAQDGKRAFDLSNGLNAGDGYRCG